MINFDLLYSELKRKKNKYPLMLSIILHSDHTSMVSIGYLNDTIGLAFDNEVSEATKRAWEQAFDEDLDM